jgi:aminoglycoside 6'-N-acetyltransferase I
MTIDEITDTDLTDWQGLVLQLWPGAEQLPVAYVEGLYVVSTHQHKGVGRMLIEQAEAWAREQGCIELASDAEISNTVGETFHRAVGFEVERIIAFIKRI